jgi:Carboxypeptidase regulatory-like domain
MRSFAGAHSSLAALDPSVRGLGKLRAGVWLRLWLQLGWSEAIMISKLKIVTFALLLTLISIAAWADKKKEQSGSSDLQFLVIKTSNGKPVRNASVILHPVNHDGEQEKGGMQLKTDADGKTGFRGIPYGKLRVQVLATGYQTFGEDFEINQPEHLITIKLSPPQKQYSIYEEHPEQKKPEAKVPEVKK